MRFAPLILTCVALAPSGVALVLHADHLSAASLSYPDPRTQQLPGEITLEGRHTVQGTFLTFSPDGTRFVACSAEKGPALYDSRSGKLIQHLSRPLGGRATAACFSPSGNAVLFSWSDISQTATLQDTDSGTSQTRFEGLVWQGQPLAFSPNGKHLAARTAEHYVCLWDVATGKPINATTSTMDGHAQKLQFCSGGAIFFSIDGKYLVTEDQIGSPIPLTEGEIRDHRPQINKFTLTASIWDASSGERVAQIGDRYDFVGHYYVGTVFRRLGIGQRCASVSISPSGKGFVFPTLQKIFLTELAFSKFVIHHALGVEPTQPLSELFDERIRSATLSPDASHIAGTAPGNKILVWHVESCAVIDSKTRLTKDHLTQYWDSLGGADPQKAHRAACALACVPEQFVDFASTALEPPKSLGRSKLADLIKKLYESDFKTREAAYQQLEAHEDDDAIPLLKEAAETIHSSEELRKRAKQLITKLQADPIPTRTRQFLWSLRILEQTAIPSAQSLLTKLTKGTPDSWLVEEAQRSLARLTKSSPRATEKQ
jgi:WD40 repeat protein